jgi:hypothetical protein
MTSKIVVGPINKGLKNDRLPFNIDNDSFPTLINAYQWRGRVKRKRGTSLLGRLTRFFNSSNPSYSSTTTILLDASGNGNLLTGFSLQTNGNIVPGLTTLTGSIGPVTYTDPTEDGYLTPTGTGGPNTINYATGDIHIPAQAGGTITAIFTYYPDLPVMGLEDFLTNSVQFPGTIAFDTKYSYNIVTAFPYPIYDVSFYKNPAVDATNLPGYVPKANETPTTWNGKDYQQFWTTNYQGALWATNGINVPFSITNIGMQYSPVTAVAAPIGNTVVITVTGSNLVVGDFVFLNEFDPAIITGINFQTGYVTAGAAPGAVTITLPFATLAGPGGLTVKGIVQYLTNRSDTTKDCLRFYDGDPTNGNVTNPTLSGTKGWVNFAPPLSILNFSIAQTPEAQYYLIGARMIVPFKDRLLFLGPVIQTSVVGSQIYLQDTIIYSQNGTPYYTASFTNSPNAAVDNPTSPTNDFHAILTPTVITSPLAYQTASPASYIEDQTGFGGFISAGIDQPLLTVQANKDVLITGFNTSQAKVIYTGNDIVPFNFFLINSELGSGSTFSSINLDEGVISRGSRGYLMTNQEQAIRIDLEIPDEVFEVRLTGNGPERFSAQRDFLNEWIYFTYPGDQDRFKFPNQTLLFNYRDNSWAIFNEAYTTYGAFRKQTGFTWQTVGLVYPTWSSWTVPWNAGSSTLLQPEVIAGNQQGFVIVRDDGDNEAHSLYIRSFSGSNVTCPDHTLNTGDYIIISGAIGTIGAEVNGRIFSVLVIDANTFTLNPSIGTGTYFGGGVIKRMYVPFIQTKQFPVSWAMSRKTRIGVQQYLLSKTTNSQITLLIFLSQDSATSFNNIEFPYPVKIVPDVTSVNDSLIYSTVLYTCPESTNLGLTPANSNLQMPTASGQNQIWHRINTSLIGDTVQLGFTMSDAQMRVLEVSTLAIAITGITLSPSPETPTVITVAYEFSPGTLIQINGVVGTTQLNGNNYYVVSSTSSSATIQVDSNSFTPYVSGGTASPVSPQNQFAEIELHGFVLDVTPSQLLS